PVSPLFMRSFDAHGGASRSGGRIALSRVVHSRVGRAVPSTERELLVMRKHAGLLWRIAAGFLLAFAVTTLMQSRNLQAQATPQPAPAALNDPTGATTGTAKDVAVKDPKNPTLGEVMDTVGHNRIAINIVWTLITGFLVMFMQAGFALVE